MGLLCEGAHTFRNWISKLGRGAAALLRRRGEQGLQEGAGSGLPQVRPHSGPETGEGQNSGHVFISRVVK